jgi:glutathione S-transferase
MSAHELLYFDGAGRAETIRICLHAGGVDFKDTRFKGADWPAIKPTTPLGSVPVLKVDGVTHCQSVSLARYAGKLGGFYPTDPVQALIVDEAIESLNELMAVAPKHSDPEELLKLRKEFQAGVMTKYADFFEGLIQKNGGVGFASTPSIADLTLWGTVKSIRTGDWTGIDATFFDSYKGIVATVDSIAKNEKVVAYYASKE